MTLAAVLAMMAALHPGAPRTGCAREVASAVATAVNLDGALPDATDDLTAALLVVYAWQESRFACHARRGDAGVAVCAFQVHAHTETNARALERSPVLCARRALFVMKASQRLCGDLSGYCGACRGRYAATLASRRLADAQRLVATASQREAF